MEYILPSFIFNLSLQIESKSQQIAYIWNMILIHYANLYLLIQEINPFTINIVYNQEDLTFDFLLFTFCMSQFWSFVALITAFLCVKFTFLVTLCFSSQSLFCIFYRYFLCRYHRITNTICYIIYLSRSSYKRIQNILNL